MANNNQRFDSSYVIGSLIIALMLGGYYFFFMKNMPEAATKQNAVKEQINSSTTDEIKSDTTTFIKQSDEKLEKIYGSFANSSIVPTDTTAVLLENELLKLEISRKGAFPQLVELKEYKTYNKTPLYLINNGNEFFNLSFFTREGKKINTDELYFVPSFDEKDSVKTLSMKLYADANSYLEFIYILKPNSYALDFDIKSVNLAYLLDKSSAPELNFELSAFHTEKGKKYENQYTYLAFAQTDKQKTDDLSISGDDTEDVKDLSWFAFKQQFFSSILRLKTGLAEAKLSSTDLKEDSLFTKRFSAQMKIPYSSGELNAPFELYFGHNKFHDLEDLGNNYSDLVPLGWTIIGWINKYIVVNIFDLLNDNWGITMGLVILIMTILIKLFLMPLTYSSYLSSAKMKLLKPEIDEINKKHQNSSPEKKQQATMELYSKAGVNPLAGCLPMLLQMPFLIAMYRFFPSAIELRGKSFLWAEDLSAYDSVFHLPFEIPLYGANVSLFTLLMAAALLFQTKTSAGDMQAQQQPGMPNMKIMLYIMPIMMIVWFNTSAAGLSYYYFISTVISILLMWIIRRFIVNEEKLHRKLQENKANAAKRGPSKFQKKLNEMMKEADSQKNRNQRRQK